MKRIVKNSLLCSLFSLVFLFSCLTFADPYNAQGDAAYDKFKQVQMGMSEGEVTLIAGPPDRRRMETAGPRVENWYYIMPGIDGAVTRIQFRQGSVDDISRVNEPVPNEFTNEMPPIDNTQFYNSQELNGQNQFNKSPVPLNNVQNKIISGMSEGDVLTLAGEPQYVAFDPQPAGAGKPHKSWYYVDNDNAVILRVQFADGHVVGITKDRM